MAKKEEERDQLFSTNLGDGLIEVDETPPASVETKAGSEEEEKPAGKEQGDGYLVHDDGTIEIDEFLQKAKENIPKPKEGEDEDDSEDEEESIEKTDKGGKDKGKETPSDSDDLSDSSPSSSPYLAFARDRAKEGVFLDFNDDDWATLLEQNNGDEPAALRELSMLSMQTLVQQGIEAYKESISEEDRALYEAKEKGLPIDKYAIAKNNFKKYSEIKSSDLEDNEKLQEELVTKALEIRGFDPDEIKEEIEGYKSLEVLESKAKKALGAIPSYYKNEIKGIEDAAAAEEESRKDQLRQRVARMKRMVEQTPEIIPGIKLNKTVRENIMKSMTQPVKVGDKGEPLNPVMATRAKNPDAFEMMIHYYHSLGLFNIDDDGNMKPDFGKISKVAKNEAADSFRKAFESKGKQGGGKPNAPKTTKDEIDEFEAAFRRIGK